MEEEDYTNFSGVNEKQYKESIREKSTDQLFEDIYHWIQGYWFDLADIVLQELKRRLKEGD